MIDIGFSTGSSENTASYFIMDICLLRKLARRKSLVSCYKNALLYPVHLYPVDFRKMDILVDTIDI